MLAIRLTRVGKKNSPAYRVVVAEKSRAVKRKFIEIIGNYNPILQPKTLVINKERALFWMQNGAQPSDTVRNLMVDLGVLGKDQKVNKKYSKAPAKEAAAEAATPVTEAKEDAPVTEAVVETETVETPEASGEVKEEIAPAETEDQAPKAEEAKS